LLREALATNERSIGAEHPLTGYQHTSLAMMLLKHQNPVDAEKESRRALEIFTTSFTGDHPYIASAKQVLGEALIALRRYREAEKELESARGIWQRTGAPGWRIGRVDSALGEAIYHQGRLDEAEALLQNGYRAVFDDSSAAPDARERAQSRLLNFYRETGRPQKIPQLTKPAS
jgi:tetratricopeptide (TPR) repeat protein